MRFLRHGIWVVVLMVAGCSGSPESGMAKGPMAEDLVCKYNGDLACVEVPTGAGTPSYAYEGKVYYFCSEKCRQDFVKDPKKYLPVAK